MPETPYVLASATLPRIVSLYQAYTGPVNRREGNNLHASCPEMEISRSLTHERGRLFMIIIEHVIRSYFVDKRERLIFNFESLQFFFF